MMHAGEKSDPAIVAEKLANASISLFVQVGRIGGKRRIEQVVLAAGSDRAEGSPTG